MPNHLATFWSSTSSWGREHRTVFAHSARVTIAALLSFIAGKILGVPLVLWPVLTSILLTQLSVGKSLKAIIDYLIGTLGGGTYAAFIAVVMPHASDLMIHLVATMDRISEGHYPQMTATLYAQAHNLGLGLTLFLVIAPLAFLAALFPRFAVAPFTGALVVFIPTITSVSPLESALVRILEVMLGGVIALIVSLVIFPARAHTQVREGAAEMIGFMVQIIPQLFGALAVKSDAATIHEIQGKIGDSFIQLNTIVEEAEHERVTHLATEPDARTLLRVMLRLRHDLILIGRAACIPIPELLQDRLIPLLNQISTITISHLQQCATALLSSGTLSLRGDLKNAFASYSLEMMEIRKEGILLRCPMDTVEHLFTLGFALEQFEQNLSDLEERIKEHSKSAHRDRMTEDASRSKFQLFSK